MEWNTENVNWRYYNTDSVLPSLPRSCFCLVMQWSSATNSGSHSNHIPLHFFYQPTEMASHICAYWDVSFWTEWVLRGHQILLPAWIGGQIFKAKTTIYMTRQIALSRRQLNTTHDMIECVQLLDGMLKDVMHETVPEKQIFSMTCSKSGKGNVVWM